jgi:hypothetical protein
MAVSVRIVGIADYDKIGSRERFDSRGLGHIKARGRKHRRVLAIGGRKNTRPAAGRKVRQKTNGRLCAACRK